MFMAKSVVTHVNLHGIFFYSQSDLTLWHLKLGIPVMQCDGQNAYCH